MLEFVNIFSEKGLLKRNEILAKYTAWKVGGPADILFMPFTIEGLQEAIIFVNAHAIPFKIIGKGSNILVSDAGFRGIIILLNELNLEIIEQSVTRFLIPAGNSLKQISRMLAQKGNTAHEFLSGIPGTIGGAIVMNAGTPAGEIKDALIQVTVMDSMGEMSKMSKSMIEYEYRHSIFHTRKDLIVLEGDFHFPKEEIKGSSLAKIKVDSKLRKIRQPLNYPNSGSVFRNPENGHAGAMIEQLGLKGLRIGGAKVSKLHANFIINTGDANAEDILILIQTIQNRVFEAYGVSLNTEVEYLGW
ncbi:UDP-N-acetylenolpyruvoylglucosamine reductase 1 [Erysipelotrichaceae bacterium]|nr:UDP-N-acetylenolpyruvoylglucosamine reductase 1 [Erysipelotrichaceae bacterium]